MTETTKSNDLSDGETPMIEDLRAMAKSIVQGEKSPELVRDFISGCLELTSELVKAGVETIDVALDTAAQELAFSFMPRADEPPPTVAPARNVAAATAEETENETDELELVELAQRICDGEDLDRAALAAFVEACKFRQLSGILVDAYSRASNILRDDQ